MIKPSIHWYRLLLVLLVVTILFGVAFYRVKIDTDILSVMPTDDPVIADSAAIFTHHPLQNRIMIDIFLEQKDPDALIVVANRVAQKLKQSGLFKTVGNDSFEKIMPLVLDHVVANLPVLFTKEMLNARIQPLLTSDAINGQLQATVRRLLGLEGIGQATILAQDPLHFRESILAQLASLAPSDRIRIHRGHLLSLDEHHLLLTAQPLFSGTDTVFARKMTALMKEVTREVDTDATFKDFNIVLTPMGAYRAALDNELMIRKDVTLAIVLATLGIAVLLVFAFPRPWVGLLSLLPAVVGTMTAFFIYSLFNDAISIMVLGFGGAIISITVDHGIAYLLFLDRPEKTDGKIASEEVRSIGLLTVLTSIGAFIVLCFSGFPIFVQLGQFSALGICISFLFVHTVFPKIFPQMPAGRKRKVLFRKTVDSFAGLGPKGAWLALGFCVTMLFFAAPKFDVGMHTLNTVSPPTQKAEKKITQVWGNFSDKVYLMTTANNIQRIQKQADRLIEPIGADISSGILSSGFLLSQLFPGPKRRQDNFAAWQAFWEPERVETITAQLKTAGASMGFSEDAFAPFLDMLKTTEQRSSNLPPAELYDMLGVSHSDDESQWFQVISLTTGNNYDATAFRKAYAAKGKIFDANHFSVALGKLLFKTFVKLFIFVAASVVLLLIVFFLDLRLTITALLPVMFALIATMGTMKLLGRAIDIPGLMLAIVVLGMGVDYSLFFVRAHQRYAKVDHPSFSLIRMAVFMAAISTLIGFGVLIFARHTLLKSAGITSFLGIGYALLGAFLILPPVLNYLNRSPVTQSCKKQDIKTRVLNRYRNMEAYPRLFARFKIKFDPIFKEISDILNPKDTVRSILDVGSGYGVPGCWLLEYYPEAFLHGIEPMPNRVRVANRAMSDRGSVILGRAPDLPQTPEKIDLAVMLDMAHFLDDDALKTLLQKLHTQITWGGHLILRVSVKPKQKHTWVWWMENIKLQFRNIPAYYRDPSTLKAMGESAGFKIDHIRYSGPHQELVWIICVAV